jgi:ADP-ribose pyrophosphatase
MKAEHGDDLSTQTPLASKPVHKGRIVNLAIDTVRYPDGSTGDLEMIRHSGAAAVLPFLDPLQHPDPRVILIKQFRYAGGGYLYEVPAGRPDQVGEPWEECAVRELREETGYTSTNVIPLTSILTTPGFTDERIHLFAATDLTPGDFGRDADEFMEVVIIPFSEALDLVRSGSISDGKTICTLLYAAQFLRS